MLRTREIRPLEIEMEHECSKGETHSSARHVRQFNRQGHRNKSQTSYEAEHDAVSGERNASSGERDTSTGERDASPGLRDALELLPDGLRGELLAGSGLSLGSSVLGRASIGI